MNEEISLISSPLDIDASWVEKALLSAGIEAGVQNVDIETVGTGQLGETRRFHISYKQKHVDLPRTLIGKFPSDNEVAASTGKEMGFYRGEVMFYRELAERTKINTPKCYLAEINAENNFVLLMEDLAPASPGDHMSGCSEQNALVAIKEAALLHAAFWNDSELEQQNWLYVPEGAQGFYTTDLIESSWDYYKDTFSSLMDEDVIKVCDKYVSSHAAWNAPREGPKCFSHNDYRVDNMLFDDKQVAVVDWQTSNYLATGMDVAYFIGSAFSRDQRRAIEHDLLAEYHKVLELEGVRNYSVSQLTDDYRHYSFAVLAVAIAAAVIVKRSPRGDELFLKMITDGAYQALDNDALDLL